MRFQLCQTLWLSSPFIPSGTLHVARDKRWMCCTWFAHEGAQATWAYVLETVHSAVRRLYKISNCTFQCDYYYFYYYLHLHLHLGFVHPLQDVALHQYLPSSSVAFLIQVVPSFSGMSSCHLLLGRPLVLFPLLGCHSVHRLVHLLSFNLAIWPAHFHFCFSVYSIISMTFVLFLISEHGILSFSFRSNIFLSIALWAVIITFS